MKQKLQRLQDLLRGYRSVLCTFSGGVDSTFLLRVAHDVLGEHCVAMTAVSPVMARAEIADAVELAAEIGCRLELCESHELDQPAFAQNPVDRCYHCKVALLENARGLADRLALHEVLLATNTDDLGDYRPGLKAAKERGAREPLVEAGFSKQEIRDLSRELGLRTWGKPAFACLASRFPYGTAITAERLRQVEGMEEGLRALGFRQLRVRYHEQLARLELEPEALVRALELKHEIVALAEQHGFKLVALDLRGYRTGSLNELIAKPK
jgi:pyridinium-3,5-biscarboxylic acid mononucleotide sulfurtransferase